MGPPSVAPGIIVIYPRELFISSKFIFDKDMGKINLILTCLAMFSCQARCQERTSSGQQGKVDKEEQTEIEICSKYAVENGYKKIGYRQFNERCKYFFNMDLDTIPNLYNMINTSYKKDTDIYIGNIKEGRIITKLYVVLTTL